MFGSKKKKFAKATDEVIRRALALYLDDEDSSEAYSAFRTTVARSEQMGRMPCDLVEQFRAGGLTSREAGMAHLDASVTEIKAWGLNVEMKPELLRLVSLIEHCIDRMFLASPTSIVPRNGKAGPELSEFTTDF